jgi:AcrR family transcriptional regulator
VGRPARVTRAQVLKAAREGFAGGGYHGTTLAAIAARLALSPAALLRHAPTKHALFVAAMSPGEAPADPFPMAFLADADPARPREVLRRLARTVIPFVEAQMSESIARWMYSKSAHGGAAIPLPFDPRSENSPPRRVFKLLEAYLRRASREGALRVRDPRAAALSFMGNINGYVFFHQVMHVVDPPIPVERYIDTFMDIWSRGAFLARRKPEA